MRLHAAIVTRAARSIDAAETRVNMTQFTTRAVSVRGLELLDLKMHESSAN